MERLTTADWDKACDWLEEKATHAKGNTSPRARPKPKGPTPTQERQAAMKRAKGDDV